MPKENSLSANQGVAVLNILIGLLALIGTAGAHSIGVEAVKIFTANKAERNKVAEQFAIDMILPDYVVVTVNKESRSLLKNLNLRYESLATRPFPTADSAFHDYSELNAEIDSLVAEYPNLVSRISIGKSTEGRDLMGVRISSSHSQDTLPTAIFIGCHHAREHLSVEVPLMLAKHLAKAYDTDARITQLLDTREVWIVPMLNPDGAEYDIATGSYRYWRKNRRDNGDRTFGVDLNRNYGAHWGGAGSSGTTSSDTYRGKSAFSEPETAAVRDFVRARKQATVLLTFHTFSELILWPWGYTDDVISNETERAVFEKMGKKMAEWNKYTPKKSSDLYITSGDTTDWAYDELKIFAFTFELSPNSMMSGGFYPGAQAIEPTFKANLEPALYLIDNAADPFAVTGQMISDPLGIL